MSVDRSLDVGAIEFGVLANALPVLDSVALDSHGVLVVVRIIFLVDGGTVVVDIVAEGAVVVGNLVAVVFVVKDQFYFIAVHNTVFYLPSYSFGPCFIFN